MSVRLKHNKKGDFGYGEIFKVAFETVIFQGFALYEQ